jgi:hypothetical protein
MITHRCGLHAVEALTFLHRDGQAIKAEHAMARLIRDLLAEVAETATSTDVAFGELSRYCFPCPHGGRQHALQGRCGPPDRRHYGRARRSTRKAHHPTPARPSTGTESRRVLAVLLYLRS